METIIRKATPQDAKGITWVHLRSWETTYGDVFPASVFESREKNKEKSESSWAQSLQNPQHNTYVAEQAGKVVGFMTFNAVSRNPSFANHTEMPAVYILKDFQGQGLGKKFFDIAKSLTQKFGKNKMMLNVLTTNPSKKFYEKMGGKAVAKANISVAGQLYMEDVMEFNF